MERQDRDRKMAFDIGSPPEPGISKPIPQPGINEGLSILVDSHDDWIDASTISEDFQGFIAYVSSGYSYPLTARQGFQILGTHGSFSA